MADGHDFQVWTLTQPTHCNLCGKFLWGIVRQGYHCRCGFNAHGKCVPLVATACPGPPRMKSPSSTDRSVPSIAGATEVLPPSSSSSTSSLAPQATESELSNQDPPLNLLTTTPRNFTRFVTRLGPVVHALEGTEDILMWRDPARTLVALLGFVFLCLFPTILIILPQCGVIYFISKKYYDKTKREVTGASPTQLPSIAATSTEYLRNMQFIQNQMGLFCEIHGKVASLLALLDWSDPDRTIRVSSITVVSAGVVIAAISYIPINYIALGLGLSLFAANTSLFRAASTTLPPALMRGIQERVDVFRESLAAAAVGPSGTLVDFVLFENQRWWAGLGWIPHLLRTERPPWSDETGGIQRQSKDSFELPSSDIGSWQWVDADWTLDTAWADVDEEGWQYTDHVWNSPKSRSNMASLTRRRAWRRKMRFLPNPVIRPVSVVSSFLAPANA